MKLIVVSGASSHPGKTSVATMLLKTLPGWGAIKVTPSRPNDVCPHGRECGACDSPEAPYELITDEIVIATPGKDTASLKEAGASQVVWVRAPLEILPEALAEALKLLSTAPGVVVETTTALPLLNSFNIMVATGEESELKDSALKCAGLVDVLAINTRDCAGAETKSISQETGEKLRLQRTSRSIRSSVPIVSGNPVPETGLPESSPLAALQPRRIITLCALLPPEHPYNLQFLEACHGGLCC